ncbi:hypothetical protein NLM31_21075 [Bradyrhizobium sp. CCGUVB4N]|uniref:hypothetical protein n=1 Tax=Bradyrhizobium sp. CCGUVB4N TaxID=2949631 RepID=UPI0020B1D52A|nr:hypothetical protein [Bradyrhizobium sp. CCGUVB4N]MCP3382863.1 hypothetical protein [Bradyrhizobium sp. CCGUVB4N]
MFGSASNGGAFLRDLREHWVARCVLLLWAVIGFYDTFGSQFLPPEWSQKRPSVFQLVTMTSGWLSWGAWLVIGAASLLIFSIWRAPLGAKAKTAGLAILAAVVVSCFAYYAVWPVQPRGPSLPPLLAKMDADFPSNDFQEPFDWDVKFSPTTVTKVRGNIYYNNQTMSKFIAFYVPNQNVYETCQRLALDLSRILVGPPNIVVNGKRERWPFKMSMQVDGDTNPQTSENAKFTGVVYLYYEGHLQDEERAQLRKRFLEQGATLRFVAAELLRQELK